MDYIIYSIIPLIVPILFLFWLLSKLLNMANSVKTSYNKLVPKRIVNNLQTTFKDDTIETVIHNSSFDNNKAAIEYYQNVIESFPKNANGEVADEYRHTDDYIKAVKFLTNNV